MYKHRTYRIILSVLLVSLTLARASHSQGFSIYPLVILDQSNITLKIGQEASLYAVTSTGELPTWSSSKSSVASVDTYGRITGKRAGTVKIRAKIKGAEDTCRVTVLKTLIFLSSDGVYLEHGDRYRLHASTTNGAPVTYKSNHSSIASVNEEGIICGDKPGRARITVSCDGSTASCPVTVKKPMLTLSPVKLSVYKSQSYSLKYQVSSRLSPSFRSNKPSIAIVDDYGKVTGIKHGTARITMSLDGVNRYCSVTVPSPSITLSSKKLTVKKGKKITLQAKVSSGNPPVFSSSSTSVATVTQKGVIRGVKKGKTTVYVSEDGAKVKCSVVVK